ncbi:hypothetical protein HanRHA438_Chr14g0652661 [Helianthus annuus]|nr:hypothetical protein HanRHA438_Chr14g0652661 [Helianthus annuus]
MIFPENVFVFTTCKFTTWLSTGIWFIVLSVLSNVVNQVQLNVPDLPFCNQATCTTCKNNQTISLVGMTPLHKPFYQSECRFLLRTCQPGSSGVVIQLVKF